jgi:hypothetical protein
MTHRLALVLLVASVTLWVAGASIVVFAESWWRIIGVALFVPAIGLAIWGGRFTRGQGDAPATDG